MQIRDINPAVFKPFGTPIRDLESYQSYPQEVIEDSGRISSNLWHYSTHIVIEPLSGVGLLFIRSPDSTIQEFLLDQAVLIRPMMQFAVLPYHCNLTFRIYSESPKTVTKTSKVLTGIGFQPAINGKTLYTVFYQEKNREFDFRGEKHPFWEFTYVNKGTLICEVDGLPYEMKQGQMMFFAPHQFHVQRSDGSAPVHFLTVSFDGDIPAPEMLCERTIFADDQALSIIRNIIKERREQSEYCDDMILCELTRLLITVIRGLHADATVKRIPTRLKVSVDNKYIDQCMEVIHQNITSTITLPWLARQLNLSSSYLSSLFKQKVGQSISEYVRLVRLEKVKDMIGEGRFTIAQISEMMGYCSPTYLSTEFKREYDMSPKEYAKMLE